MAIDYTRTLWGGPSAARCISDLLTAAVERDPEAIAVVDGDREFSYAALMTWAAEMASDLSAAGSVPADRVGIACPRGAEAVAALLAVTLSGRTYVPLDMAYPRRRLEHMLTDSGAGAVLHSGTGHGLGGDAVSVPVRRPAAGAPVGPIDRSWVAAHDPDLPVYIIYTSGSTGWPKGVVLPHSCLDNVAAWQAASSVTPDLRTAQFAPLNFDVSYQEIFGTLCAGGTLVVMPESLRRDSIGLLDWLVDHSIERLFLPYVALQMLAVAAGFGGPVDRLALREINVAGEPLVRTEEITAFFTAVPRCRLANHYGQSESAMVSYYVLPSDVTAWPLLPPVGVPLPGCELLMDVDDPVEGVGELLVAGAPLALGYLNQPELNARRYIDIRPTVHGHTRAFRTGDLVRFVDGTAQLLTRIDDDVKLRGVRICLAEVEAQLMALPGIAAAVVVVTGGGAAPKALRAAVRPKNPEALFDEQDVRRRLADCLPEVSVPISVTALDDMPRTPSGKADRDAVAELIAAAAL